MAVITISRELGSEGSYIATHVAKDLGYVLVDKKIIEQVLSQYGYVQFGKDYETIPNFWERLDPAKGNMISMLNRVLQAMASFGNVVIMGRGSFAVLGDFTDVLNVRLQAPLTVRIRRIMSERNIKDLDSAEALVRESDKVRSAFIQSWYNIRWDQADAFDLVIDTSKVPPDMAVRWIIEAHSGLKDLRISFKPTTRTIQVDRVLAGAVADVLNGQSISPLTNHG
jgi:cytidylate kinase